MQEALALPTALRVRLKLLYRRRKREKRRVFEIELSDGSTLIRPDIRFFGFGEYGAELIAPQYCGICRVATDHVFYHATNSVNCICCHNPLGANDARPLAPLLPLGY